MATRSLLLTAILASVLMLLWGLPGRAQNFDPLLTATSPLVLQANFGSTQPPVPTNGGAAPAAVLRNEFPARLFGTANAAFDLIITPTASAAGTELRAYDDQTVIQDFPNTPYTAHIVPVGGSWSWEGRFSVPEPADGSIPPLVYLTATTGNGGNSVHIVLGQVWVMAGSPNLAGGLIQSASENGMKMGTFPAPSGSVPSGPAIVPPGNNPPQVWVVTTTNVQAAAPSGAAPPSNTSGANGPVLAMQFAKTLAVGIRRPVAVYVVAHPRALISAWRLVPRAPGATQALAHTNPFWDPLGGQARLQSTTVTTGDPPTVSARGLIWWQDEWQAESDPALSANASVSAGLDAFENAYLDALVHGDSNAQPSTLGGLLIDVPTLLTTGRNAANAPLASAAAARMFARVIIQTQAMNRQPRIGDRFPFGRVAPAGAAATDASVAWAQYQIPDSSWARLRNAQTRARELLRQANLEARIVSLIASPLAEHLPAHADWSKADPVAFTELSGLLVRASSEAVRHSELFADDAPHHPQPPPYPNGQRQNNDFVVKPPGPASDGPLQAVATVSAHFEAHILNDPASQWRPLDTPDIRGGSLIFAVSDPAHPGEHLPIDRVRYAWGDNPGALHRYHIEVPASQGSDVLLLPFITP